MAKSARKTSELFTQRFNQLTTKAKRKKMELDIGFQQYCRLIIDANCYYCESEIKNTTGHSLDRVDNSKGYLLNNVVVCCAECNQLKSNILTTDEAKVVAKALKSFRNKLKRGKNNGNST